MYFHRMAARAPPRRRRSQGPGGAPGQGPNSFTVPTSPGPELRTRVWLEFVGFPSQLWSAPAAAACLATFGAVITHFDAAEFRRSGRMVVEAHVARVAEVLKRVIVYEFDVPGLPPDQFPRHDVRLVVLSFEPVFDEEEGNKGKKKKKSKNRFVAPPSARAGESKVVGTQERPEFIRIFLSRTLSG